MKKPIVSPSRVLSQDRKVQVIIAGLLGMVFKPFLARDAMLAWDMLSSCVCHKPVPGGDVQEWLATIPPISSFPFL